MTATDNLRVLRQTAQAARRIHIANTMGARHKPATAATRLPGLQRLLNGLDAALELQPGARRPAPAPARQD